MYFANEDSGQRTCLASIAMISFPQIRMKIYLTNLVPEGLSKHKLSIKKEKKIPNTYDIGPFCASQILASKPC